MAKDIYFVAGTDTDVGKTIVAAAISWKLSQNQPSYYWKPVQTGPRDSEVIERLAPQINLLAETFHFKNPVSPDQAASGEEQVDFDKLKTAIAELPDAPIVVEAAGGLFVPLNDQNQTWFDFLSSLPDAKIVLVARTSLGTINHTSLSISSLRRHGFEPNQIVLNGEFHQKNLASLKRMWPHETFTCFPKVELSDVETWSVAAQSLRLSSRLEESSIIERDRKHTWHPYTQHQTAPDPLVLARANGVWLETNRNQRLFDGISSWWVNTVGHGRAEIGEAIAAQQAKLDHTIFAGATHEPGIDLSQRLSNLLGDGFDKVFYSDNGSTAVEVGLKMAFQAWTNRGIKERKKFLSFRGSYHGDTFGTMSIADASQFHEIFQPLMFETDFLTPGYSHQNYLCKKPDFDQSRRDLESYFAANHTAIAGVLIEPLVQGAGGMLMHDVNWLNSLGVLCAEYEIPLIFDEVFTGFGRTGEAFAYQHLDFVPDVVCLAKGITGGNLPLAVTVTSNRFFEHFLGEDKTKALLHGHSYTANPIGCAAALATLDIYEKGKLFDQGERFESRYRRWFEENETKISNPRLCGSIMAFELAGSGFGDYHNGSAADVVEKCFDNGLFIRPLGNTLYLVPPLVANDTELDFALEVLSASL